MTISQIFSLLFIILTFSLVALSIIVCGYSLVKYTISQESKKPIKKFKKRLVQWYIRIKTNRRKYIKYFIISYFVAAIIIIMLI